MERRQFERKSLGAKNKLQVSLYLSSQSLLDEKRREEFELEASATDISRGGIGLKLSVLADLCALRPNHNVTVRLKKNGNETIVPARIAHFETDHGTMGLEFRKLLSKNLMAATYEGS